MNTPNASKRKLPRLLPRPDLVEAGYFKVIKGQTMVTPRGLVWLAARYLDEESVADVANYIRKRRPDLSSVMH